MSEPEFFLNKEQTEYLKNTLFNKLIDHSNGCDELFCKLCQFLTDTFIENREIFGVEKK